MGHRDSRTRNPTNFQMDYSQSFVPIAAKRSSSTSRGKAPTAVTGAETMIIAEDRHIPKTRLTQRYNQFTKSWEGNKNPALNVDTRQNPLTGGKVQTEEDLRTSEQIVRPQFDNKIVQQFIIQAERQFKAD